MLDVIAGMSGVQSAVLGDRSGGLLDARGEPEGETVAAVTAFLAGAVVEAGEQLGLGALTRISLGGAREARVVLLHGDVLVTARIEPARALPNVELVLEARLVAAEQGEA